MVPQSKELQQKKLKEQSDEDFLSSILSGSDRRGAEEDYELANKSKWVKVLSLSLSPSLPLSLSPSLPPPPPPLSF